MACTIPKALSTVDPSSWYPLSDLDASDVIELIQQTNHVLAAGGPTILVASGINLFYDVPGPQGAIAFAVWHSKIDMAVEIYDGATMIASTRYFGKIGWTIENIYVDMPEYLRVYVAGVGVVSIRPYFPVVSE